MAIVIFKQHSTKLIYMKSIFAFLITTLIALSAYSQNIDYSKDKKTVLVDGVECLTYEGKEVPGVTYSNKAGEELFFIGFARDYLGNTYWKVTFLKSKQVMSYRVNFASKKSFLAKAVKEGLLKDCTLNEEKIESFIMKYNEQIN